MAKLEHLFIFSSLSVIFCEKLCMEHWQSEIAQFVPPNRLVQPCRLFISPHDLHARIHCVGSSHENLSAVLKRYGSDKNCWRPLELVIENSAEDWSVFGEPEIYVDQVKEKIFHPVEEKLSRLLIRNFNTMGKKKYFPRGAFHRLHFLHLLKMENVILDRFHLKTLPENSTFLETIILKNVTIRDLDYRSNGRFSELSRNVCFVVENAILPCKMLGYCDEICRRKPSRVLHPAAIFYSDHFIKQSDPDAFESGNEKCGFPEDPSDRKCFGENGEQVYVPEYPNRRIEKYSTTESPELTNNGLRKTFATANFVFSFLFTLLLDSIVQK